MNIYDLTVRNVVVNMTTLCSVPPYLGDLLGTDLVLIYIAA